VPRVQERRIEMRRGAEWLIILACALLVVGLIAYARGPKHHHGDTLGTHGTTIVVVPPPHP
jgi:ABC-type transport system involved in cytochrome c biogenesis permease component